MQIGASNAALLARLVSIGHTLVSLAAGRSFTTVHNGVRTYMPTEDYMCEDCPTYRQRDNTVELLVGCSGWTSIV